jgi:hypothetical protein
VIRDETCGSSSGVFVTQYGSSMSLTGAWSPEPVLVRRWQHHSDGAFELTDSTVRDNGPCRPAAAACTSGRSRRSRAARSRQHRPRKRRRDPVARPTISIVNSTISGNRATYYNSGTPQYFAGYGGGIFAYASTLTLRHVTVTANIADWTYFHQFNGSGGGIATNESGTMILENSIVAGNIAENDCQITSGGVSSAGSFGCSTIVVDDPVVGALGDNGGPTLTHTLLDGSPALDSGAPSACEAVDQRGEPRPSGEACDAGSYERQVIVEPPPTVPRPIRRPAITRPDDDPLGTTDARSGSILASSIASAGHDHDQRGRCHGGRAERRDDRRPGHRPPVGRERDVGLRRGRYERRLGDRAR